MAILSNINGKFAVDSTGAIQFSGAAGTSGYILESAGVGASPTWIPKSDIVGAYLPLAGGILTGATSTASGISFTVGGTLTGTTATFTGDVNITQTADVGVLNTTNLDSGAAVGLSLTYPTTNVAAGDGLAIAIGITGRGRSYIANSNVTTNLDASNLVFYTEDGGVIGDRMIINSSGNVGIGTTSPGSKLTINGQVQVGPDAARRYALQPSQWGYSSSYRTLILGSASTSYNTNDTGSVTLAFGVDVSGNSSGSFTGDGRELLFRNGAKFTTPNTANNGYHSNILVLNDGNVGIGNTAPSWPLTVGGNVGFKTTTADGSENRFYFQVGGAADPGIFYVYNGAETVTTQIHGAGVSYFNGGKVGIGTTVPPFQKLTITGVSGAADGLLENGILSLTTGTGVIADTRLLFGIVDDNYAWLQAADYGVAYRDIALNPNGGNVGIGTTSPDTLLNLEGAVNTSIITLGCTKNDSSWSGERIGGINFYSADGSGPGASVRGSINYIATSSSGGDTAMTFATGDNTEKIRIENNGNIRVSFNSSGAGAGNLYFQDVDNGATMFYIQPAEYKGTTPYNVNYINAANSTHIGFIAGGAARMRITSGGDILFRNPALPSASSLLGSGFKYDSKSRMTLVQACDSTVLSDLQEYFNPNGAVGKIQTSASATIFNTSSDYRLKEDLKDFNGLDKVSNIKVYDFKWKIDGKRSYGVLAHELQEVIPDAAAGEKDLVNEDGSINPQGVDYSKIVPILIKSIQELETRVKELENK